MVKLLPITFLGQGYTELTIDPTFLEDAIKLELKTSNPFNNNNKRKPPTLRDGNKVFVHLQYHKRNISCQIIRNSYEKNIRVIR